MEHYFTRRALLENVHDQLISHHIGWSVILGTATRLITLSSAISPQITLEPMWLPKIFMFNYCMQYGNRQWE